VVLGILTAWLILRGPALSAARRFCFSGKLFTDRLDASPARTALLLLLRSALDVSLLPCLQGCSLLVRCMRL